MAIHGFVLKKYTKPAHERDMQVPPGPAPTLQRPLTGRYNQ